MAWKFVWLLLVVASCSSNLGIVNGFSTFSRIKQQPRLVVVMHSSPREEAALSLPNNNNINNALKDAFASLNESDKYDAVLTGLCAKILDTGGGSSSNPNDSTSPLGVLEQPLTLLSEMNQRKVEASARSLSALLDVSVCCCCCFDKLQCSAVPE